MPVDPRIQAALDAPLRQQAARKPTNGRARKTGYPMWPGTGPADMTCKDCRHFRRYQAAKTYRKCALTETRGPATDIKSRSPACARFEAPDA